MTTTPQIEGYEDFEQIGSGGFSHVFRARQVRYDRWVAVKVMHAANLDDRTRRRFERECQLTGRLTGHPHIVTALDAGFTARGNPYLTTDYYAKGSLGDLIEMAGPLDVRNTLAVGVKVAGALETAHRAGVLHRDVKPQNILISAFGEPALGDFGISLAVLRAESSTRAALTPLHAPPEVLDGENTHPSSDVYSLGSTLYALLAGRAPFETLNPDTETEGIFQVLRRILTKPVPPIDRDDVPAPVYDVITRAMAKDLAERFASPLELGEALQAVEQQIGLPPTSIVCPPPEQDLPGEQAPAQTVRLGSGPAVDLVEIQLRRSGEGGRLVVTFDERDDGERTTSTLLAHEAQGRDEGPDALGSDGGRAGRRAGSGPDRIVVDLTDSDLPT